MRLLLMVSESFSMSMKFDIYILVTFSLSTNRNNVKKNYKQLTIFSQCFQGV